MLLAFSLKVIKEIYDKMISNTVWYLMEYVVHVVQNHAMNAYALFSVSELKNIIHTAKKLDINMIVIGSMIEPN
jgi:hypothetical protein